MRTLGTGRGRGGREIYFIVSVFQEYGNVILGLVGEKTIRKPA